MNKFLYDLLFITQSVSLLAIIYMLYKNYTILQGVITRQDFLKAMLDNIESLVEDIQSSMGTLLREKRDRDKGE